MHLLHHLIAFSTNFLKQIFTYRSICTRKWPMCRTVMAAMSKVCRSVCCLYAGTLTYSSAILVCNQVVCFKRETCLHFQKFFNQSLWMSLLICNIFPSSISLPSCRIALKPNQNVNKLKIRQNMYVKTKVGQNL